MATTVGKARIEIEVDGSGITKSLEDAMDRALETVARSAGVTFSGLERDAASAGDGMGSGIEAGARQAESALGGISGSFDAAATSASNMGSAGSSAGDAAATGAANAASAFDEVAGAASSVGDGFDDAGDKAEGFGGRLKGMLGSIGQGILGPGIGANIGNSIMNGISGAMSAGWESALDIDTATRVLEGLYEDATLAEETMGQLREVSRTSPIDYTSYLEAAEGLAFVGVEGSAAVDIMENVGLAAIGAGRDGGQAFESMNGALTRMVNEGRVTLDTLDMMGNAGIPIASGLAEELGVQLGEVRDLVSDGAVELQDVLNVLGEGTGQYFEQQMTAGLEAAGSLGNQLSVLADNLNTEIGLALQPVLAEMDWSEIGRQVSDLATSLVGLIPHLLDLAMWFVDNREWILPLAGVIAGIVGAMKAWQTVQLALNMAMFANPIGLVVAAIAALVAGLTYFFTQTEIGQKIWDGFMDALGTAWEWLSGVFAGVWDTISEAAVGAFEWISDAWDTLWGGLQAVWDAVGQPIVDLVVGAFSLWWEGVQLYFRLLRAAWEVLWTGLQMAWDAFGQPIIDFVVAAFQFLWSGVEVVFGWLKSGWEMLWDGVRSVYDTVIAPVVQWVQDRFEDLRSGVSTALDFVKDAIQSAADRVSEFWDTYVQPMVDSVINGFNRVVDTVTGWKDTIVDALKDAGSWLVDTGKNIVQGLIDGIKSLAGTIGDAFLNLLPGWIKEPFKVALGIESPSKVFAEYGQNIGEGLIEGIDGMEGRVGDAVEGITEAATPAAVATPMLADSGPLAAPVAAPETASDPMPMSAPIVPEISTTASVDLDAADLAGAMGEAGESVVAVREGMIDPALTGMAENLTGLAATAGIEGENMTNAMNLAGAGVLGAKDTLVDPALWGMQANMAQTALTTQQQMLGTALPAMQQTGAGVVDVQNRSVDPALTNMQGAINNTAGVFATGTARMNTEFNKVREGTAAPVRFTIGTVFNDGLVGMWNNVSEMVGLEKMNTYPIRFASGGVLPGYTPGRDPFTFVEPFTGMSIGLSGGEAIMRPEWTRAVGPAGVEAMNAAARSGGTAAVQRLLAPHGGNRLAFASGGIMPGLHLGDFSQGAVIDSMTNFVNRFFPELTLTSGWRFTDSGYHSRGLAGDYSNQVAGGPPTPASIGLANAIYRNFAGQTAQLIHAPLQGWQNLLHGIPHNYGAVTDRQHWDHVHWALERPLMAAGTDLDLSGGVGVAVDPREIIESMMGSDLEDVKNRAHSYSGPGGMTADLPGAIHDAIIEPMMDTLEEAFLAFGGDPGGADVARWRPLAMQALARHGYDASQYIDAMMQQIMIESGGNPQALNLWDSNAAAGHPSGGLLQVIEPTYRRVRNAYPDAFEGLPDDHWHPLTNLTAGVGAVKMDWGGPAGRWPTTAGYDLGGIANGIGLMPKHILDPERVLSPRQTEAFEAWMDAGARVEDINRLVEALTWREDPANLPVVQPEKVLTPDQEAVFDEWRGQGSQIDSIHELVDSMHGLQLDHPEVMGREINRRFRAWLGEAPEDNTGDVRHLVAALEAGVEWERVTRGMQRSAEAWANGQWVQVGEDTRLATPAEMGAQVHENFMEELADELGGYVGLSGLYKGRDIVGESGLVKLELPDEVKDAEVVPSTEGAPVVATATPTATGKTTAGEAQNVEVTVNIDVSGVNDPMAVSDLVMAKVGKGVEEAIGTARSQ